MKTIDQIIAQYISSGMTREQAGNVACQRIIINKISKSPLADNILLKGGIVMFNLTNDLRRSTVDLDFDFIRHDISDSSIKAFIELLNKHDSFYHIELINLKELQQDDYRGKRANVTVSDNDTTLVFKMDIGVHALLGIEQSSACFSFDDEQVFLKANPPEQMFSEKLYSLAKHGALFTRFKDIYDMFYLIKYTRMDRKKIRNCLELLTIKGLYDIRSVEDVCGRTNEALEDRMFLKELSRFKNKWIDESDSDIIATILDYIYSI